MALIRDFRYVAHFQGLDPPNDAYGETAWVPVYSTGCCAHAPNHGFCPTPRYTMMYSGMTTAQHPMFGQIMMPVYAFSACLLRGWGRHLMHYLGMRNDRPVYGYYCCPPCLPDRRWLPDTIYGHVRNACGCWHFPMQINSHPGYNPNNPLQSTICVPHWWGTTDQIQCRQDAYTPCGEAGKYIFGILLCYGGAESFGCTLSAACCRNYLLPGESQTNCEVEGPEIFSTISLPYVTLDPYDSGDVVVDYSARELCAVCKINPDSTTIMRVTEQNINPWNDCP